ncbi:MAG: molybdenum ABC transporter ATP-binding protein [Rhodospirillales bacterium]
MAECCLDIRLSYPAFTLEVAHAFTLRGITALFGQSGCGKSTLLRVVAGHETGATGRLTFDGEVWQDRGVFTPPHRRGIGYVFQDSRLFPHLSVEGNLRFAARRAAGVDGRIEFDDVVARLDLGPLLGRRAPSLSGGERQRVAIGRSLLTRPRLLLMDEPLAALDVGRKADIMPYIAMLTEAFGLPIVYVTHSLDEVTRLADRMVAMSNGRIAAVGEVAELLERLDLQPTTGRFEAGAVLSGRVVGHDAPFRMTRVVLDGQHLEIPELDLPAGATVRLRVRARDVALATTRPEGISIRNVLEGRVAEIVEEPDTAFAETLIDIGCQRLRARLTRAAVSELALAPGRPVFALVKSVAFDRRGMAR